MHARGLRVKFRCSTAPQLPLKVHANFLGRQLLRLFILFVVVVVVHVVALLRLVDVVVVVALLRLFRLLLSLQVKKGGSGGGGDVVGRVAGVVVGCAPLERDPRRVLLAQCPGAPAAFAWLGATQSTQQRRVVSKTLIKDVRGCR